MLLLLLLLRAVHVVRVPRRRARLHAVTLVRPRALINSPHAALLRVEAHEQPVEAHATRLALRERAARVCARLAAVPRLALPPLGRLAHGLSGSGTGAAWLSPDAAARLSPDAALSKSVAPSPPILLQICQN